MCDGIDELGHDLADVFANVDAVIAGDEDAAARLAAAGVDPGRWIRLGPTNVIAAPGDDTFVYDPDRWQIDEVDGELVLSNLVERLTRCDRLATGRRGRVTQPGRLRIDD